LPSGVDELDVPDRSRGAEPGRGLHGEHRSGRCAERTCARDRADVGEEAAHLLRVARKRGSIRAGDGAEGAIHLSAVV